MATRLSLLLAVLAVFISPYQATADCFKHREMIESLIGLQIPSSKETLYYSNGAYAYLDGTAYYQNGAYACLNGTIYYENGAYAELNDTIYYRNGAYAELDGTWYHQSGSYACLNGTRYYKNGTIASSGGQCDESTMLRFIGW